MDQGSGQLLWTLRLDALLARLHTSGWGRQDDAEGKEAEYFEASVFMITHMPCSPIDCCIYIVLGNEEVNDS